MKTKKLMEIVDGLREALFALQEAEEADTARDADLPPWQSMFERSPAPPPAPPEVEGTAGIPAVFVDNPHELYLTLQGRTGKVTHITAHPPTAYPGDCKVVKFIRVDESVYHGTQMEEQEKEQV